MKQTKEIRLTIGYYTDEYELTDIPPRGPESDNYIVKLDKPFPKGIDDFPHRHMGGQEYFLVKLSLSEHRELQLNKVL